MRYFVLLLLSFLTCSAALAQPTVDTTLQLPVAVVQESVVNALKTNVEEIVIEKIRQFQSTAEVLGQEGSVYLKSYGPGTLSTASVRGGTASQLAVLWEGLPIQSPQSGVLDLALVQGLGFERLELTTGGASTLAGSGALTGALNLRSATTTSGWKAQIGLGVGSFDAQIGQAQLGYGHGNWQWQLSAVQQQATNDFPFSTVGSTQERTQDHAATRFWSTQQQLVWTPNDRHRFKLLAWQQAGDRELPPRTTSTVSEATQYDQSWRQQVSWQYQSHRAIWKTQAGYFRDKLLYTDPRALLRPAASGFNTYLLRSQREQSIGEHWLLKSGLFIQHNNAFADGYQDNRTLTEFAFFQTVDYRPTKHWQLQAAGRAVWTSEQDRLVVGHLSANWRGDHDGWSVRFSRDYRLPTLNDRYWIPGGRPDLATELSWEQSITWTWRKELGSWIWSFDLPIYHRQTENWLQWSLREGEVFFSASNIAEVRTWGIEPVIKMSRKINQQQLTWQFRYFGGQSTYQTAVENPKIEVGEQLPYVPLHRIHMALEWSFSRFSFSYVQQWASETAGLQADLPAYALAQLRADANWKLGKWESTSFIQINNLWDTDYRVIEFRAMPGRSYQLGLLLQWNQNAK